MCSLGEELKYFVGNIAKKVGLNFYASTNAKVQSAKIFNRTIPSNNGLSNEEKAYYCNKFTDIARITDAGELKSRSKQLIEHAQIKVLKNKIDALHNFPTFSSYSTGMQHRLHDASIAHPAERKGKIKALEEIVAHAEYHLITDKKVLDDCEQVEKFLPKIFRSLSDEQKKVQPLWVELVHLRYENITAQQRTLRTNPPIRGIEQKLNQIKEFCRDNNISLISL